MPEYMSFERMQAIAKEVGVYFYTNSPSNASRIEGATFKDYTSVYVIYQNGSVGEENIKNIHSGWIRIGTSKDIKYYRGMFYSRSYETWKGYYLGSVNITNAQIKEGLAILQAGGRNPIYVGTKQVSAIYVKSSGTIKTAKPYIKQNGQIKAL